MAFNKSSGRRHVAAVVAIAASLAMTLTACSGNNAGTGSTTSAPPAQSPAASATDLTGNITLWHFFTDREATVIQSSIDAFTAANPGITVDVVSGQDDDKMRTAIAAGQPIDVGISYSSDQIGPLCSTGAFLDLGPYIQRDNIDLSQIPDVVQSYTQFEGTRCSLPMLADTTGLYYNKDLFAAAGITDPPKTLDELAADAIKLTTKNPDGSIKTLGFMPLMEYYESNASNMAVMAGAKWLNDDNKTSAIGSDPNWTTLLNWQQKLINDLGGYKALSDWFAAAGDEFSDQNDFETGRVAMEIDGEWRVAFINDEAPDLNYGTSPMPTLDPSRYGATLIDGNLVGIPKGSPNPDLAWELVKYLALDTDAQVAMGNGLKNVPTIKSAVTSPNLETSPQYQTFLDAFTNPNSSTEPRTIVGTEYGDIMSTFIQDWESGAQTDLAAGLANVDQQINAAIALGG